MSWRTSSTFKCTIYNLNKSNNFHTRLAKFRNPVVMPFFTKMNAPTDKEILGIFFDIKITNNATALTVQPYAYVPYSISRYGTENIFGNKIFPTNHVFSIKLPNIYKITLSMVALDANYANSVAETSLTFKRGSSVYKTIRNLQRNSKNQDEAVSIVDYYVPASEYGKFDTVELRNVGGSTIFKDTVLTCYSEYDTSSRRNYIPLNDSQLNVLVSERS